MKKIIFLAALMLPVLGLAQDKTTNLWTGLSLSKSITKRISLEADAQWRLTNNLRTAGAYIGELGITYKFNKHLEVSGYYRFINRRKYDKGDQEWVYKPYHRFYANLNYDRKIGFLKFDYRLRYQNQFKDDNGNFENDKSYLRNKLEVAYPNKTKFTPAISADLFYRMGEKFDELRYKAEVNYKINKKNALGAGGFISHEFDKATTNNLTLLLTYKVKF
ncbi:DUF2490 domain-containing protein [Emticicia sp. TH156]|uniref:DUF2490 domain-containing protein n=1 Tax=Emticicia sp. TH156 TaxID=2067454 RepID=UPI000C794379|nr:DUF2490 domain-containing protein [Emticicia sp. TH156]PLK42327.1 DUF2490 domain-containing protein [Emticicia sp. TH156]